MIELELEPLSSAARALIALESERAGAPRAARDAVLAGVLGAAAFAVPAALAASGGAVIQALPVAGASTAGAASAGAATLLTTTTAKLLALTLSASLGAAGTYAVTRSDPDPALRAENTRLRAELTALRAQLKPSDPTTPFAAERLLLERAQSALLRNDPPTAKAALAEHARRFPGGLFEEEREALHIRALQQSGDPAAPAAREAFRRRFPHSPHLVPPRDVK
jgi:hypothetical protein